MQRKVNQIGPSTLMVSLPSKWVKKYNVKKGDSLEVEEKDDQLAIYSQMRCSKGSKVILNINNLNTSVIWYYLITAYRSGADEIELHFIKKTVQDDTAQREIEIASFLQMIVGGFIGMEIVRNTPIYAFMKEISTIKQEEYGVIFRRIFYSVLVTFDDILQSVANQDKTTLMHIFNNADIQINKFVDYCIRIHSKSSARPSAEYAVILHLEEIGDSLKHLARLLTVKSSDDKVKEIITALKKLFSTLEKFYFTGDRESLIHFEAQKRTIREMLRSFPKQNDLGVLMVLTNILNQSLSIMYSKLLITHQQESQ